MKRSLAAIALITALATPAAASAQTLTPPPISELPDCSATIAPRVHPYYGLGWVAQCSDGLAFVVPSRYHKWAIIYGAFTDLQWTLQPQYQALMQEAADHPRTPTP